MEALIGVLLGLCLLASPFVILYLLLRGARRNTHTRERVEALEQAVESLRAHVETLSTRLEVRPTVQPSLAVSVAVLEAPGAVPSPIVVEPRVAEDISELSPQPGPFTPMAPAPTFEVERTEIDQGATTVLEDLRGRDDVAKKAETHVTWRDRIAGTDWEEIVGGNWLNKAGVLVFVIGLSLFLGYSLTRFGPMGRVAIGWGVSIVLLGGGTLVERRHGYGLFGRGLLAGGWASAYFTAYAMYALPAARVIENPIGGTALLLAIAGSMVVHSLRYQSEGLTGLTYFVAFATLNAAPASTFTLLASAPLAASLLTVTYRRRWPMMSVVGLIFTYGSLLLKMATSTTAATVDELRVVQAILVVYWLLFELFDLIDFRSGTSERLLGTLFPLNAAGFLGLSVLLWADHPGASIYIYSLSAAGYLASATARALVKPRTFAEPAAHATEDDWQRARGYQGAVTVAAALAAASIALKFHGIQLATGLAWEGELLLLSGFRLKSRYLRGLASFVIVSAMLTLVPVITSPATDTFVLLGVILHPWVPLAMLIATAFYLNAALVRSIKNVGAEPFYLSGATALSAAIAWDLVPHHYAGLAWLALAWVLVEVGLLAWEECLIQASLLGVVAVSDILWNTEFRSTIAHPSLALGASAFASAIVSVRLFKIGKIERSIHQTLRDAVALASIIFVTMCAWHVLPATAVAMAWAAIALALVDGGRALGWRFLMTAGDVLAMVVFGRLFAANLTAEGDVRGVSTRLLTVVPAVPLFYYLGATTETGSARTMRSRMFFWMGSALVFALMRFELGRVFTAAAWSAFAVGLMILARRNRDIDLTNQSYVVAVAAAIRGWVTNFQAPDSTGGLPLEMMVAAIVVCGMYVCEFLVPRHWSDADNAGEPPLRWIDRHARELFAVVATALAATVLFHDAPSGLLTVFWALQGLLLLAVGFAVREPILRRSGLVLLAICLTKVLAYDSRQLDILARIMSFMLLGSVLIFVSWIYTRFGSRLGRYL